jgi:NADH dehydrogenase
VPDIAAPIRHILRRQENVTVLLAEARGIDPEGRRLLLDAGDLTFDHLIVATGATHSYFGHDDWADVAPGLKTLDDALEVRRRVLMAFEMAERETDPGTRQEWLTFVIVGAGPTGVELAGALTEIARHTLPDEFRRADPRRARVVLVEAAPRVLPPYPPELSDSARRQLERLGVEVRTGAMVTGLDAGGVTLGETRLAARTVLWAAGVAASPLGRSLGDTDRAGRVKVNTDLTVPGFPAISVVGDLASLEQDGRPVPGVAPAANQMGAHAARNVLRVVAGGQRRPFRYVDKGSLATIGRKSGVAVVGRWKLSGLAAWLAWMGIHVFFLIGFRNRIVVMLDWAYSYLTYARSARVVTGPPPGTPDR